VSSDLLTIGVEEELFTVDLATRMVAPRAAAVLKHAGARLGDRVGGEFTQMQLELRTAPHRNALELHDEICESRALLAAAAAQEGVGIVASGSPVLGSVVPAAITQGARQLQGDRMFRGLHDEVTMCAAHVHVGIADRERAILAGNHLRPILPLLIALAANSPYWCGRDTGYASWRTISWQRWPVAGPPPYFTSAGHYEQTVTALLSPGALVDRGTIFWDIRPSHHVPTLELRVTDVPLLASTTALLAVLMRALVARALEAVERGDPGPRVPAELLRAAYWRAARDGLDGYVIDVPSATLRPAADQIRKLLDDLAPMLGDDLDPARRWLGELLAGGSGAVRQRHAASSGGLTAVVDHLLEQTAGAQRS
jgi:glutamate---cysteine ligase / carboxylate-amine ligase